MAGDLKATARFYGETLFNLVGTHVPSHRLRQGWLRLAGCRIGTRTSILRGTTVLGADQLVIGDRCSIGWRCVLDARGGLTIDHDVVIASDTQLITADHDPHSPEFAVRLGSISVGHHAWLASRSMILAGVRLGPGSVAAAGAVVINDVPERVIVGGVPAKPIGERPAELAYRIDFRPPLY